MYLKTGLLAVLISMSLLLSCNKREEVKRLVEGGPPSLTVDKKKKPKDGRFGFKLKKPSTSSKSASPSRLSATDSRLSVTAAKAAYVEKNKSLSIKEKRPPAHKKPAGKIEKRVDKKLRFGLHPKTAREADSISKEHYHAAQKLLGRDDNLAMKHVKEARRLSDNGSLIYLQALIYSNKGIWSRAENYAFIASRKSKYLHIKHKLDALTLRLKCLKNLQDVHPSEALHEKIRRAIVEIEIEKGK